VSKRALIVFDLDDTLYPERQYVRSGYRAVSRCLDERFGNGNRFEQFLWNRFCRGSAAGAFDALNSEFGLGLSSRQILDLVTVYREHPPEIQAFRAMPHLLSLLHGRYSLGLLSDGFLPAQRLKLEALQLTRFFDEVVYTEEMGRESWKPSPDGFQRMSEAMDVPHERCAYVGDNLAKDFIAPNSLGWLTVRYVHPGQVHRLPAPDESALPQHTVHLPGQLMETVIGWSR